jgi:hypothetical protein
MMFCFVCQCEGELKHQEEETRNPRWIKVSDLKNILDSQKVFDLEKPFFDFYCNYHE